MLFVADLVFLECPNIKLAAKKYSDIKRVRDNAIQGARNPAFEYDNEEEGKNPEVAVSFTKGSASDDIKEQFKNHCEDTMTPINVYMMKISDGLAFLAKRHEVQDASEQTSREWMESANAIDRLFSVVFFLLGAFTTIVMIWLAAA